MLDFNKTMYELLADDRDLLNFFILNGFEQLKNPMMLEVAGKKLTLEMACKARGVDKEAFIKKYEAWLEGMESGEDSSLQRKHEAKNADITIRGILPCPLRVPMLESFERFIKENGLQDAIDYDLRSANLGMDWMMDKVRDAKTEDDLPDMFMSAGFELFFDKKLMGRFIQDGIYHYEEMKVHPRYTDYECNLSDPKKNYNIMGVVPAVFIVNHTVLGDREVPKTWEDLLRDDLYNDVAVPMGDLDMFNAIMINFYSQFGMDAIKKLGRNFATDLHPSQMVKKKTPAVSVGPFFFASMIQPGANMSWVWPEDGAIASPIFAIIKKSKKDKLQPILDFMNSEEMVEITSAQGKFPSMNPHAKHVLATNQKLIFPKWDILNNEDISAVLEECEKTFYAAAKEA